MRSVQVFVLMFMALPVMAWAQSSGGGAPPYGGPGPATSNPFSNRSSNIATADTRSDIAPSLPAPSLAAGDRPSDFLHAAAGALAAGRTREAQNALEMAQTRLLDRSVPLFQTHSPSDNPTVAEINQALQALASNDRATCMQEIETAIGSATAQGL
jgi:hypothetical protein